VPTPATKKSTAPSVSRQISSAVVRRWTAGFEGFENCWRMTLSGILAWSSSALAMAPRMPFEPSVRTSLAPRILKSLRRSRLIVSGMVNTSFKPRAAATKASAMPVFPLVGSISTESLSMRPEASASSIIATPMRSLTLESGLKNSSLSRMSATAPWARAVRWSRTSGVLPMVSVMSLKMRDMGAGIRCSARPPGGSGIPRGSSGARRRVHPPAGGAAPFAVSPK